jgi:Fe(3+) dicitrate transport protein
VPHHQLAARVGVQQGKDWGAHLSVTYVGVMRETAGPTLPYGGFGLGNDEDDVSDRLTDDYATVDLVGQYQVFDGAQVYVKIDNLFNTRAIVSRRPFGARPTAPVQGRVGFKYNFF